MSFSYKCKQQIKSKTIQLQYNTEDELLYLLSIYNIYGKSMLQSSLNL